MQRLLAFPLEEPSEVAELRQKSTDAPADLTAQIALGVALGQSGCSYEAASILRPLRKHWTNLPDSAQAQHALDAQTWWNKNWRDFAQLRQAGKQAAALTLLGDRAVDYWDLPPLLVHLGDIAAADNNLDLADHLYQRVFYLSERGLPKMNMAAFAYVSQAGLVDTLLRGGKADEALERHQKITPNPGNAMAHELQHAKLLVATENFDAALRQAAATLITAEKHRTGYSKAIRLEFLETAAELAPLREHPDWVDMTKDPSTYLQGS